jgi:hypothetical protein
MGMSLLSNVRTPVLSSTLEADLFCVRCGYDLRTLTAESLCPECGLPIRDTIANRADVGWLRVVRRGLTALIIVAALTIVIFVASMALPLMPRYAAGLWPYLFRFFLWASFFLRLSYPASAVVQILAVLWLTRPPDYVPASLRALRRLARVVTAVGQGASVVSGIAALFPQAASFGSWMLIWAVIVPVEAAGAILCLAYADRLAATLHKRVKQWGGILAAIGVALCLLHEITIIETSRSIIGVQSGAIYLPSSCYQVAYMICAFGGIALNAAYIIFFTLRRRILSRAILAASTGGQQ